MSTEIVSPLADIIRRAAESKIEGPFAKLKKRMADATNEIVVLADTSDSMDERVGNLNMRKCEHLVIALKDVLQYYPKIRIISFGTLVKEVDHPDHLPAPSGGTPLAKALVLAQKFRPRKTIIISDGCPDNQITAKTEADKLTGVIDSVYCGPENHPAADFLESLCKDAGGTRFTWDGYRGEISSVIRGLLA